jgi:hypothetical protein
MILIPWLKAFALTLIIECSVVFFIFRQVLAPACPKWRQFSLMVFANLATHPAVWFIFPELPVGPWLSLGLSEGYAVGAEAFIYALVFPGVSWERATVASLAANAASFGIGLLLYRFAGTWMMSVNILLGTDNYG